VENRAESRRNTPKRLGTVRIKRQRRGEGARRYPEISFLANSRKIKTYFISDLFLTLPSPAPTMQPESSDGFASVGTILPEEGAALLPGGSFRFYGACFEDRSRSSSEPPAESVHWQNGKLTANRKGVRSKRNAGSNLHGRRGSKARLRARSGVCQPGRSGA
jgi:hypothetical protein